jgi:hypothetical protein
VRSEIAARGGISRQPRTHWGHARRIRRHRQPTDRIEGETDCKRIIELLARGTGSEDCSHVIRIYRRSRVSWRSMSNVACSGSPMAAALRSDNIAETAFPLPYARCATAECALIQNAHVIRRWCPGARHTFCRATPRLCSQRIRRSCRKRRCIAAGHSSLHRITNRSGCDCRGLWGWQILNAAKNLDDEPFDGGRDHRCYRRVRVFSVLYLISVPFVERGWSFRVIAWSLILLTSTFGILLAGPILLGGILVGMTLYLLARRMISENIRIVCS